METKEIEIAATPENIWSKPIDIVKARKIQISFNNTLRFAIEDVTSKGVMIPLVSDNKNEIRTIIKEEFI